jgi:Ca2+-binding RTX toxin-like protein
MAKKAAKAGLTQTGGYGADTLFGQNDDDTFKGGYGDDYLLGGGGKDKLYGDQNDDQLMGGDGDDTLDGGSGADTLTGEAGKDKILGGAGDDTVMVTNTADAKGDTVDGGSGVDSLTLYVSSETKAIKFTASDPIKSVSFNGLFTIEGIEKFSITAGTGKDQITGYRLSDYLDGGAGDDKLGGAGGDDYLQGGKGNDTLDGGLNSDFISGGEGKDVITGGSGNDYLYADSTSDTGNEVDKLTGGAGDDWATIGIKDTADGGVGSDRLHLDFTASKIGESFTFGASNSFASGGSAKAFEVLEFDGGSAKDSVTGGALGDTLHGNGGDDVLNGGKGDDEIDGGAGKDTLHGNDGSDVLTDDAGADKLYGDAGDDTIHVGSEAIDKDVIDGGAGTDAVWFSDDAGYSVYLDMGDQKKHDGVAKGDSFTGIEVFHGTELDDVMLGGNSSKVGDRFYGEDGDDVLNGRAGDDYLNGGSGSDTLTGGAGKDVFALTAADDGEGDGDDDGDDFPDIGAYFNGDHWKGDIVTDFKQGQDKLQVSLEEFGLSSSKAFVLTVGNNPTPGTSGPNFLFDTATDRLWFDADGKGGDHEPLLLATFENGVTLKSSDFIFG